MYGRIRLAVGGAIDSDMTRPYNARHADSGKLAVRGLTRTLMVAGGTLCVALGVLGIFMPVLPTTPFLLLAAFCYARSSDRFHHRLMTNRWFGDYIRNYREGRGIPLKQKVLTILLLWLTIGYAAWFVVPAWWAKAILLGIAAGVTGHLIRTKTFKPEARDPLRVIDGEALGNDSARRSPCDTA
jgi:uncharacterized membrane protein YbaN (DUF454 family)